MTEVSLNTKKEYALYYHDKGFSVCILHHNPPHLRKIAAIKWGKYQEERADKTQIAAWWDKDPEYNIMLIMGSISKAIALDVDGDVAKKRLEEKLVEMSTNLRVEFQDTMKNKSGGGGYHFVFRIEDDISDIGNKELWTDGGPHSEIKLKANGGYIVGAPSIHDSGNLYEWNGKDPALITRQQLNELIRLLSPVSEQQQQKQQQPMGASIGEGVEGGGCYRRLTIDDMEVLLKLIMPVYTDGTRDMFLFSLTGAMRKEGFPHEDTEKLVEEISKRSPYSNENMEKNLLVVDATYQKPIDDPRAIRGKAGLRGVLVDNYQPKDEKERQSRIDTFTQICQIINYVKPASAGSSSSNDDGGDGDGGGGTPPSEDDDNKKDNNKRSNKTLSTGAGLLRDKTVEDDETMIISYLATQVISRITVKAFLDTQEIIYYDQRRKHYSSGGGKRGESVINAEIEKIVDEIKAPYSVRGSIKSEVVKSIADRNPVNREDVDADPYTINLDNCLLDIFELVQMDQTPDYLTFSKFPIVYDTDAECPRIERFLGEVIIDTHKLREVLKFLGYILLKSCKYEKLLLLLGGGSNGKSVLIKLLEAFVGRENVSNLSLQEMEEDRFGRARLFGKTMNCYADNKSQRLKETGNLKTVISGDTIEAQNKFQPRFSFRPRAKIVISTNNPPESDDKTHAFYRRILPVNFERTFVATTDESDPNKRDAELIDKLTTPEEMSGLLNLALRYLKVLIKENGFTEEPIDKVKQEYERQADHISRYLGLYCTIDPMKKDQRTRTEDLYAHYVRTCIEKEKMKPSEILDENVFGSRLVEHGILKKKHRVTKGEGRGRPYFYEPVVIREEYNTEQTSFDQVKEFLKDDEQPGFKRNKTCPHCVPRVKPNTFNNLRDYQLHLIFRHPEVGLEEEES